MSSNIYKQQAYETLAGTVIKALEKRGMEGHYYPTGKECLEAILAMIPHNSTVAWGGSESIKEIGLLDAIKNGPYEAIDRATATSYEESRALFAKAVISDYYLMSTNAITQDGILVNIDGAGNRVACMIHGPENIIMVVGMNKMTTNTGEAIDRVHSKAAPPNVKRLNKQTPCNATGICGDCLSPDCICAHTVITRFCRQKNRIKVFLVGEDLGY